MFITSDFYGRKWKATYLCWLFLEILTWFIIAKTKKREKNTQIQITHWIDGRWYVSYRSLCGGIIEPFRKWEDQGRLQNKSWRCSRTRKPWHDKRRRLWSVVGAFALHPWLREQKFTELFREKQCELMTTSIKRLGWMSAVKTIRGNSFSFFNPPEVKLSSISKQGCRDWQQTIKNLNKLFCQKWVIVLLFKHLQNRAKLESL